MLPDKLNTISITGNVYKEGNYPLDKYKNLKALIEDAAMGLKPETYMDKVDVIKENLFTGLKSFKTFNLNDIIDGSENYILEEMMNRYILKIMFMVKTRKYQFQVL